jgi:hypothetical protein
MWFPGQAAGKSIAFCNCVTDSKLRRDKRRLRNQRVRLFSVPKLPVESNHAVMPPRAAQHER